MTTEEQIDAMPIAEVKLNFYGLMDDIVSTYGDDESQESSWEESREANET